MVSIRNRLEIKQCESILKHNTIIFTQSLNNKPTLTNLSPIIKKLGFVAHFSKNAVLRKAISTTAYNALEASLHGQVCVLFKNSQDVSSIKQLIKALNTSQFNHVILGGICFKKTWTLPGIQTMLQMHEKFADNSISSILHSCQGRLTGFLPSITLRIIFLINSLHSRDENK